MSKCAATISVARSPTRIDSVSSHRRALAPCVRAVRITYVTQTRGDQQARLLAIAQPLRGNPEGARPLPVDRFFRQAEGKKRKRR